MYGLLYVVYARTLGYFDHKVLRADLMISIFLVGCLLMVYSIMRDIMTQSKTNWTGEFYPVVLYKKPNNYFAIMSLHGSYFSTWFLSNSM